jgi:phage terminase large subunit
VIQIPTIDPRPYQLPTLEYFDDCTLPGLRAVDVWARRCGKDLTYMNVACKASFQRKGLYVHFLPEAEHARRTLWDGFTIEGDRIIDIAFPKEIREKTLEQEMRIELKNGCAWQLGGSDQYDRWVGGNPIGITFSEFALAHPKAWEIMRPILKVNGGWAGFISTPRGYNHLHKMLELAKAEPGWHWSVVNALEAGVLTEQDIQDEIRQGMPEELAAQEYMCSFAAANVGSVLGKYIEIADSEGRITQQPVYDPDGGPIMVSCDIGYHDSAAFWFWQLRTDGFGLVHHMEDNGLDAQDWIDRLRTQPFAIDTLWLPHDARAKTFQTKHTVVEQFLQSGVADKVKLVPLVKIQDRINAARTVLPRCWFHHAACAEGLISLREWQFRWNDDTRTFSREPKHDWASHSADAFSYGALMLRELVKTAPKPKLPKVAAHSFTLEQLWDDRDRATASRRI